jgi:predicted phosphodiesterase
MTKTDFIRSYIIENDLYTLPTRTLTKKILSENPKMFGEYNDLNFENLRSIIRRIRYSHTNNTRKNEGHYEGDKLFAERFHGYFEPDMNDYSPFIIPKEVTRLGILNDIHIPFYNKENLNAAIDYLKSKEVNGIFLNGDIIDCYKSSNFLRDPRQRDMIDEFNMLREFIDSLNSTFNCPIYYKLGNHEERIENSVIRSLPELVHFVSFENCLSDAGKFDLSEYKLTIIKDKRIVKFTDYLSLIHGHEYGGFFNNPVGVARWLYTKAKANAACAHSHKKDSFAARNIKGEVIETHSIGCLCDMYPKYRPLNDWQSGFAYVRKTERGYKFSNLLIEDGVVL